MKTLDIGSGIQPSIGPVCTGQVAIMPCTIVRTAGAAMTLSESGDSSPPSIATATEISTRSNSICQDLFPRPAMHSVSLTFSENHVLCRQGAGIDSHRGGRLLTRVRSGQLSWRDCWREPASRLREGGKI